MGLFKVAALGLIFPVLPAWLSCQVWHILFAWFSVRRCLAIALLPWLMIAGLLLMRRLLPIYSDQIGQVISAPLGAGYWLARRCDAAEGLGEFLALYAAFAVYSFPLATAFGAPLWVLVCAWSWSPSDTHGSAAWETASEAASDAFNWLAELDLADPESLSDAASLADALVMRSHGHADAHWDDAAAHLLQGLILYVASLPPEDRHPGILRALVAQPEGDLLRLCQKLSTETTLAHGLLARAANAFLGKADRERSGVLSTVTRHTHFLDDPRLVQASRTSSFSFVDLKTRAITIYIVLPPDKLRTHARFARLVFGQAIGAMTRIAGRPRDPVLFLVDEFAQLGYFSAIEDAISILRGYGVTLWLLVQDLSQLQAIYPRWRSFLANSTLQAFGSQDYATTEHLSRLLGHKTITVESKSKGKHNSTTSHPQARALMTSDEIRCLGSHRVMVFEQGRPAQVLQRLNYLLDQESRRCFDDNPTHTPPAGRELS